MSRLIEGNETFWPENLEDLEIVEILSLFLRILEYLWAVGAYGEEFL